MKDCYDKNCYQCYLDGEECSRLNERFVSEAELEVIEEMPDGTPVKVFPYQKRILDEAKQIAETR